MEAYDANRKKFFNLRVVLLWTINDFPTYGNLKGCTVKGYNACPYCGLDAPKCRLKHGGKNAMAGMKGVADVVGGANMDAPESSNATRGVNIGARQNKKLKTRKERIVVQYNVLGVPAGDEATKLAFYLEVLASSSVSILFSDWRKVPTETKERLWESI